MKFQRFFIMEVQGATQKWAFGSPLTLELSIVQGVWQGISHATFRIYNLSREMNSDIFQLSIDQGSFRQIKLWAGYRYSNSTQLPSGQWVSPPTNSAGPTDTFYLDKKYVPFRPPLIFDGNIISSSSSREGPIWITTIEAWDGGFARTNSYVSISFAPGVTFQNIASSLINSMGTTVSVGYISPDITINNLKGMTVMGNPYDKLLNLCAGLNADMYINFGKIYIVKKGQPVPSLGTFSIDSTTGLLDTPQIEFPKYSFKMLFEPRIMLGQTASVTSLLSVTSGDFTVGGISHNGMISDAVGGDLTTRVECYTPKAFIPAGMVP